MNPLTNSNIKMKEIHIETIVMVPLLRESGRGV